MDILKYFTDDLNLINTRTVGFSEAQRGFYWTYVSVYTAFTVRIVIFHCKFRQEREPENFKEEPDFASLGILGLSHPHVGARVSEVRALRWGPARRFLLKLTHDGELEQEQAQLLSGVNKISLIFWEIIC